MLEGLSRSSLPRAGVNQPIEFGGRILRPDFWFVLAQLVVEVDGPGHRSPARAAEDAARDAHLPSTVSWCCGSPMTRSATISTGASSRSFDGTASAWSSSPLAGPPERPPARQPVHPVPGLRVLGVPAGASAVLWPGVRRLTARTARTAVEHQLVPVRVLEERHVADARVHRRAHERNPLRLELRTHRGDIIGTERDRVALLRDERHAVASGSQIAKHVEPAHCSYCACSSGRMPRTSR